EVGHIGLDEMEQLQDHGGHAAEVAGPGSAAEAVLKPVNLHIGAEARQVYGLDFGGEDQVGAFPRANLQVLLERARIAGEVLGGTELNRVDEDGDHDEAGLAAGGPAQAGMAGV